MTYVDRPEAGTVAGSHIGVECLNGCDSGCLTVLLVHVVCAGSRVVSDPNAEVLDLQGVLLRDLEGRELLFSSRLQNGCTYDIDADDLASGLLHLLETTKEIPETGFSDDSIRREDAHAVEGRSRVGLRGQMAPNDLVLLKTT